MKSILKYFSILFFVLILSGCGVAVKPNQIEPKDKKSVDVVLPNNRILKTPIIDVKQLKYDFFLNVLKRLNNVNDYSNNCEITKTDIDDWNNINEIAKKNICLLNYNDKDFKVLRAVADESLSSAYYAFSKPEKDLSTPYIYLEVEYIDKSKGIINAVYKNDKIYYLIYSETLEKSKYDTDKVTHSLFTKIFYYPSGNVKSYSTKSSFYNYKIGMECEYKEDGTIIKELNNEELFNSNLNDIDEVINSYYGNQIPTYNEVKLLSSFNQYTSYQMNFNRYQKTNYGEVWKIESKKEKILIDDLKKEIIGKNNFIELSDKEYFQKYDNKDFKEVEKELDTKILIIKDSEYP